MIRASSDPWGMPVFIQPQDQRDDILVVDDDPDSRAWARRWLEQAGFTVREAGDAEEAGAAIAQKVPDLILLDLLLPGTDGFDLTRRFRSTPALAGVPIILVTVLDDVESKVRGFEAGANEFLSKFPDRGELLARVRTLIRSKRAQEELRAERDKVAFLYRVSRELSSDLDFNATLSRVLELTIESVGASRGSLILLDEGGGVLRHIFSYQGKVATVADAVHRRVVQEGLAGWVIEHREPVLLTDAQQDPRWVNVPHSSFVTRSAVAVPLVHPDRIAGVLTLAHEEAGRFGPNHIELLQSIASQSAVALVNARLFEVVSQERAQLEAILSGTDDSIIATDRELRITLLNPAAERTLGITMGQAMGWPIAEALPPSPLVEAFRRARDGTGPVRPGELTLADGRTFFFTLSTVSLGSRGEGGWVAVMQDITHLKHLDRLKNEFVAVVSHDLRTPLSNIHGYAEVLEKMVEGDALEYAEQIRVQSERTARLVEELLDLGKIESGMEAVREPCNLRQLIVEAVQAASFQAELSGVVLRMDVAASCGLVDGNPLRLRQALDNLIGNAIKYTPVGGVVTVRAWEEDRQVTVLVQDNGRGIPRESLPRIFEKFYRVPAEAGRTPGTGLGLAIVKAVIEQHGGQVWVESELGRGSTFGFSLPIQGEE